MQAVLKLLTGLGFRKVMCVLGNDMLALAEELQISFPDFLIDFIPAPDIRDKKPRPAFAGKQGLIDGNTSAVRPELEDSIGQLIERGRAYFSPNTA